MINNIELVNFRNHSQFKTDFIKGLNIITGNNGSGKTSILEAIFMLAMTKSFRTNLTKYTVKNGEEFAKIISKINGNDDVEYILDNRIKFQKIYKCNDIPKTFVDMFGTLNIVLFEPEDLNLILMEPEKRRKYFNIFISQTDKQYFEYLSKYNKCLKSRNKLLYLIKRNKAKKEELDFWNQQLVKYGSYTISKRAQLVESLNESISKKYKLISNRNDAIDILYRININNNNSPIEDFTDNEKNIKLYESILKQSYDIDVLTEKTNYGIHRDDFVFTINKNKAKFFASRGEIRSIIIALKSIEIEKLDKLCQHSPTILLDDILSELDEYRTDYLLDVVSKYQTILTTAVLPKGVSSKKIIKLSK